MLAHFFADKPAFADSYQKMLFSKCYSLSLWRHLPCDFEGDVK